MEILIDARMISPQVHGIGRYALNLIRGLARRGHRVTILSHLAETPEVIGRENLADVISCRSPFARPQEALELSGKIRGRAFDVFHFPSFSVPLVLPQNSVVTICDLIHMRTGTRAHHLYYRTIVRRALMKCSHVITISQWTKDDVVEKLKIPEKKISVVRIGLEDKWFKSRASEEKPRRPEIPQPYFLCLSNPKPHKNLRTLITACTRLWDQGLDFQLAVSLGGAELPARWNLSGSHREKIRVLKNLKDEELFSYFTYAKALVSPSFYEGFDYPAAEALTLGKTVVLSEGSAHEELSGKNLRFYRPADDPGALSKILSETLEEKEPGNSSEHNVTRLEQTVDETLEIYKRVIAADKSGRGPST